MTTIINGSSPSITFSDSTTQASAGLTAASPTIASGVLTFPDATTQTTAFNSSNAVTSVTAGTGISVSASTGGVTITNTAPSVTAGEAKAWINYKGTATVSIRASYNISSVTVNGTGNYTLNFTNAFADTNYCPVSSGSNGTDGLPPFPITLTTTSYNFNTKAFGGGYQDAVNINIAIFR